MAAPAIAIVSETSEKVVERAQMVMARELPAYDYEKVFWNSTWTIGLVGLSWMAVKLGQIINTVTGTIGGAVKFFTDQPANSIQTGFFNTAEYIEGAKKNQNVPTGWIGYYALKQMQDAARKGDFTLYNAYKEKMFVEWDEAYPSEQSDRLSLRDQYATWLKGNQGNGVIIQFTVQGVLDALDNVFNTYGPIIPISAVGAHVGLEYFKKRKYLSENEQKAAKITAGLAAIGIIYTFMPKPLKAPDEPPANGNGNGNGTVPDYGNTVGKIYNGPMTYVLLKYGGFTVWRDTTMDADPVYYWVCARNSDNLIIYVHYGTGGTNAVIELMKQKIDAWNNASGGGAR